MTNEKIIEVLEGYKAKLVEMDIRAIQFPDYESPTSNFTTNEMLSHLHYMCDTAIGFVNEGRIPKAFRWLGNIQGCLWVLGIYTLDDLKEHSRPR